MSDTRLKSLAERINKAMDDVKERQDHVRDLYDEAKGVGYIPKVLRKAITRQRMDASKREEEDSILELYDHALGNIGAALEAISKGATWEEAGKAHNVPRATLARSAAVSKRREMIPETAEPDTRPGGDGGTAENEAASAPVAAEHCGERAEPLGASGEPWGGTLTTPPLGPQDHSDDAAPQNSAPQPAPNGGVGAGTNSGDMPPIPDFLRRVA